MRVLGLDLGDKTVGVAVSDALGWTAQGVEIIRRNNPAEYKQSLGRIAQLIDEYEVGEIVLGYPKNLDNSEGVRCEKTKAYKERLEKRFPKIPVVLWDERFSTVAANNSMMEAGLSHDKRKSVIDKMAAVFILQGYLDSKGK
ncbi:MAG: Holliday junction resolvase RuvX [Clostridia bacterium]|nr:Holliday junction resolvase RuvX [Clostridia bacterium]